MDTFSVAHPEISRRKKYCKQLSARMKSLVKITIKYPEFIVKWTEKCLKVMSNKFNEHENILDSISHKSNVINNGKLPITIEAIHH